MVNKRNQGSSYDSSFKIGSNLIRNQGSSYDSSFKIGSNLIKNENTKK